MARAEKMSLTKKMEARHLNLAEQIEPGTELTENRLKNRGSIFYQKEVNKNT